MVTVLQALFWQFALAMAEQAGRRPAKITVGSTLSVRASTFLCQYGLIRRWASIFSCKNEIVHIVGKSIIQMLLRGHQ